MARQVIKKDNGKYAYFSTILDDFLLDDCSQQDIVDFRIAEENEKIQNDLSEIFTKLDNDIDPYMGFGHSYKEACFYKEANS